MTVTREVAQRVPGRGAALQLPEVESAVLKEASWFAKLLPDQSIGGLGPEMFTTRLVWMLRKSARGDGKLLAAAHNDPDSFLFAATECASWNVVPGEEFWFVPFDDKAHGTGPHVTGMPGWKGEVQQILRSGAAVAVVKELVWRDARNPSLQDGWRDWKPAEMIIPDHTFNPDVPHVPDNVWMGYAFARLLTGGITHPVVYGPAEFELARSHSRAGGEQFWGKLGNDQIFHRGKWYARMCLKTLVHRVYDEVPHSAGYVTQLMTAFAQAADRFPMIQMPQLPEAEETGTAPGLVMPAAVPGAVERPVPPDLPGQAARPQTAGGEMFWDPGLTTRPPAKPAPATAGAAPSGSAARSDLDGPVSGETQGVLLAAIEETGWDGRQDPARMLAVIGALAAPRSEPLRLDTINQLTERQGRIAVSVLRQAINDAPGSGEPAAAFLQDLYETVTAAAAPAGPGSDPLRELAAAFTAAGLPPKDNQANRAKIAELASAYARRELASANDLTPDEAGGLRQQVLEATAEAAGDGGDPLVVLAGRAAGWEQQWRDQDPDGYDAFDGKRFSL